MIVVFSLAKVRKAIVPAAEVILAVIVLTYLAGKVIAYFRG